MKKEKFGNNWVKFLSTVCCMPNQGSKSKQMGHMLGRWSL